MGIFFKRSRAANSAIPGRIGPKLELFQDIMVVLLPCKNEEDPIKNEGPRVLVTIILYEPRHKKTGCFAYAKTKTQISFAVTAMLIRGFRAFVFCHTDSAIPLL